MIEVVQEINQLALNLKESYGRRLSDKNSTNPVIIAARAKMEAYNEVLEIVRKNV